MEGIIGKKIGMSAIFDESGAFVPCTFIEAGPCYISQIKTIDKDGYNAIQLAYDNKKKVKESKPMLGHFAKASIDPKRKLVEFRDFSLKEGEQKLGDQIDVSMFQEGEYIDVVGITKGKGFQGVVKRHGFSGVGMRSHGQHNRERAPGSLGASSWPSRVFKGMRMAGRTGGARHTVQNLRVLKVLKDKNILVVSGSVPGAKGGYLLIEK
ncbi:MAG: 50S ribosomal protein L3 [Solitalea-like symbiont of Acarus siro]